MQVRVTLEREHEKYGRNSFSPNALLSVHMYRNKDFADFCSGKRVRGYGKKTGPTLRNRNKCMNKINGKTVWEIKVKVCWKPGRVKLKVRNDDDDIKTKNEVDGKRRTKLSGKDGEI